MSGTTDKNVKLFSPGLRLMKAFALALALSCVLSQMTVGAFAAEQYVSETRSSAGSLAINASLPNAGFAAMPRSRVLSNEACELLNTAQYDAAESKLRTAIAMEPDLASAHCNLGLLLNKTGRAQEAIPHLEFAAKQAPQAPAPVVTLAASYQLCGDLKRAISLYNEYLERFPSAPDAAVISDIVSHLQNESAQNHKSENFHWNKRQLKVFVHNAAAVAGYRSAFNGLLQEAFLAWSQSGDMSFEFVDNAQQADIECEWTDDVSKLSSVGEGGEAVLRHRGSMVTHANLTLLTRRAVNHSKLSDAEVRTLCLHEVGHALGLMAHSSDPDDVMFCTLTAAATPSSNDFHNLQELYHSN